MKYLVFILSILVSLHSTCPNIEICFTPGEDYTKRIVYTLSGAEESILLQVYELCQLLLLQFIVFLMMDAKGV